MLSFGPARSFSAVDLNPQGFSSSLALATNGSEQVGYGTGAATENEFNALLWSGAANNVVDLQQYLPSEFIDSRATGIDAEGDIVGYAIDTSGQSHAILWEAVPEPSTFALLTVAAIGMAGYTWRKRRFRLARCSCQDVRLTLRYSPFRAASRSLCGSQWR